MNYSALIQNRKSVRSFTDKKVPLSVAESVKTYYEKSAKRLFPEIQTGLCLFREDVKSVLEGSAGYNQFLVGAPQYLVLLSEGGHAARLNAGFLMEDMVLYLTDLGLDSCWVTFTDSNQVKKALEIESSLEVAAIVAFGYGVKETKRLRINILSMSNVDIKAKRRYFEPKRSVNDMVFLNSWGNSHRVEDYIGFFDDMLWEAFYAASLSPSYLNRQAYGFVIHDGGITLVSRPDSYNNEIDGDLSLGIAMLHFTAVAEHWAGKLRWSLGAPGANLQLPEGYKAIAVCVM